MFDFAEFRVQRFSKSSLFLCFLGNQTDIINLQKDNLVILVVDLLDHQYQISKEISS